MEGATVLIALGLLFLGGLALDKIGRIVHVPRVTLLILLGAVLGPPLLDVLPDAIFASGDLYASAALTMVAFLLGGSLKLDTLKTHGRAILSISIVVVLVSVALVAGGLILIGAPVELALILGAISAATAPAATRDVVRQSGAKGPFAENLLGIVAIDDAWGLLAFSVMLTAAGAVAGTHDAAAMLHGLWEVGGALLLGAAIGLPGAYLTGRLKPGEPTLLEAVGVVLLCAGLALWLEVSFLLAGMTAGAVVVNVARHHERPFHALEGIEWPFVLLFFVMAGASLEMEYLGEIGLIGAAYVVLRFVARPVGGALGGRLGRLAPPEGMLTGVALMPQAGVAIGMALVAQDRVPDLAGQIMAITIASTIVFEIVGPVCTQWALARSERLTPPEAVPRAAPRTPDAATGTPRP
ncbi:cation:proton antiporter [Rhodobacteraceae bacterium CCMM004]|nr:cation:proton antiporter [Rhodobacteraceae bacterium CCMM004]